MAYEAPFAQKQNSGAIFKNDKKEQDSHPDGKGSALIGGVEYWVSSWNNVGKNGTQYRSLSFQRKDQAKPQAEPKQAAPRQEARQASAKSNAGGFADMDDDIPFSDPLKNRAYSLCV